MAMSFAKPKQQKEPQADPGIHCAVCVGVWDLGLQAPSGAFAGGKPSEKVMLAWENQEGILITADYTRVIDAWKDKEGNIQQTKLKKHLESWFAPKKIEDPALFDARKLLGQHCQLVVSHTNGGYAKIDAITRPDKDKMNWTPTREFMYYEIGDEMPQGTPNWIISRINSRIDPQAASGEENQDQPKAQQASGSVVPGQKVPF
jgi:hypothetical protein